MTVTNRLVKKSCVPCRGDVPPLGQKDRGRLLSQITGWEVVDTHRLRKIFKTRDYVSALALVNRIGELAENEGHHPELLLSWGSVRVEIWTHKVDDLTENDFILAAKIDDILNKQ